ncbi:MAG: FG-GAP repeat domain-containing protein [Acidimicrobiales bacterium]
MTGPRCGPVRRGARVAAGLVAAVALALPAGCGDDTPAAGPVTTAPTAGPAGATDQAPLGTTTAGDPPTTTTDGPGRLVDATAGSGLDDALLGIRGHAAAVADINGDGWDDLFVGTFADRDREDYRARGADGPAPDRLLLGSADGFVVDPDFPGRLGRTAGAAFADLDGDGDPDLVVSRNVRDGDRQDAPSEVYRNDGGHLVPATVLDTVRGGRDVAILDVDRDGRPDLVVVEDRWSGGETAVLRNLGGLRFAGPGDGFGWPGEVTGLGVAVTDLDLDGRPDLVVGGDNRWFLGTGDGFVEGAPALAWPRRGDEDDPALVTPADLDGDPATPDAVIVGQHFNSVVDTGVGEPFRIYQPMVTGADGDVTMVEVTAAAGIPALTTKSPRVVALDLTGDGRPELVTTASVGGVDDRRPIVLTAGDPTDGPGGVPHYSPADGIGGDHYWVEAVVLDANGDHRPDVFFVEWEPSEPSRLFLNLPADP